MIKHIITPPKRVFRVLAKPADKSPEYGDPDTLARCAEIEGRVRFLQDALMLEAQVWHEVLTEAYWRATPARSFTEYCTNLGANYTTIYQKILLYQRWIVEAGLTLADVRGVHINKLQAAIRLAVDRQHALALVAAARRMKLDSFKDMCRKIEQLGSEMPPDVTGEHTDRHSTKLEDDSSNEEPPDRHI